MNVNHFFWIILAILIFNFTYNLYYFFLAKYYYSRYVKHIEDGDWFIRENRQNIEKLFRQAGIEDSLIPDTEPAGYGFVRTGSFSVFMNMANLRSDVVQIINGDFREAIAVYRNRAVNTFNPFSWVEFIIFLPKHLFSYLGVSSDSIFIKIMQLIYWLLGLVGTISSIVFNQQLIDWIQSL